MNDGTSSYHPPGGAPTAAMGSGGVGGINPFGPFTVGGEGGTLQQPPPQEQPPAQPQTWAQQPSASYPSSDAGSVISSQSNPFVAPQQQQQQQLFQPQPTGYGGAYGSNPYAPVPAPPTNVAAVMPNNNAMVISNTQTNPYGMTSLPNQNPFALQPLPQQPNNPWGLPPQPQPQLNGGTAVGGASYDPFAAPPAPALYNYPPPPPPATTSQALEPYKPRHMVEHQPVTNSEEPAIDPFFDPPAPASLPPAPAPAPKRKPEPVQRKVSETTGPPPDALTTPSGTFYPPQVQFGQKKLDVDPNEEEPIEQRRNQESPRNPFAQQIARQAPPGASPLPKADMVRKRGFVLARISFRTIVMKKWKQAYWVQYGPHTMLWFRSQQDFDDWLNNPYHQQAERNFLIKLAVNFVHDLYKPNVRGYQVTQCRTKGYGNKMVRQFKLERWMDYGPTIAAAFGSYNPKEVDALREAIVECMRNTPLNGGIRATGAVRQPNPPPRDQNDDRGALERQDGTTLLCLLDRRKCLCHILFFVLWKAYLTLTHSRLVSLSAYMIFSFRISAFQRKSL
jgi:hypothetical protein